MQPEQLEGISTLADWVYDQFAPTDPIQVTNILDEPYKFKYCVGEEIVSPDPTTKQVVSRRYEEKTIPAGDSIVLLGAAAYIFVDGIARTYTFKHKGAEATADIAQLVEAAKKAIVGKVSYSQTPAVPVAPKEDDRGGVPVDHNPNAFKDDKGNLPPTQSTDGEEEFADANLSGDDLKVIPAVKADPDKGVEEQPARFFIKGKEVSSEEYNEAQNAQNQG